MAVGDGWSRLFARHRASDHDEKHNVLIVVQDKVCDLIIDIPEQPTEKQVTKVHNPTMDTRMRKAFSATLSSLSSMRLLLCSMHAMILILSYFHS